jgi:hypothetical protein
MPRPESYQSAVFDQGHTWSYSDERGVSGHLGARFAFNVPGVIVGVKYLRHPLNHGAMIGGVWGADGARALTWSMQPPPPDDAEPETAQWHNLYLHPRYRITVGVKTEVGVHFDSLYYAFEAGGGEVGRTVGDITIPDNNYDGTRSAWLYHYGKILDGFDGGTTSAYGIDVLFLADAS